MESFFHVDQEKESAGTQITLNLTKINTENALLCITILYVISGIWEKGDCSGRDGCQNYRFSISSYVVQETDGRGEGEGLQELPEAFQRTALMHVPY